MPIVDYTPKLFGDVSEMVSQFPGIRNLAHRPFVDYYYATREWSNLSRNVQEMCLPRPRKPSHI